MRLDRNNPAAAINPTNSKHLELSHVLVAEAGGHELLDHRLDPIRAQVLVHVNVQLVAVGIDQRSAPRRLAASPR